MFVFCNNMLVHYMHVKVCRYKNSALAQSVLVVQLLFGMRICLRAFAFDHLCGKLNSL